MSSMAKSDASTQSRSLIKLLLPVALIGLIGSSIPFVHPFMIGDPRWITFFVLLMFVSIKKYLIRFLDNKFALFLILYLTWCFFTSFWSNVPLLSFLKSTALIISALTMISAGIAWTINQKWHKTLDYIWMISLLTLFAGFSGLSSSFYSNIWYEGNVGNANLFGMLILISIPYILWKTYINKYNKKKYFIWIFLLLSSLYFLILSMSRASMMAVILTFLGFTISLKMTKKTFLLITSLIFCLSTIALNPSAVDNIINITKFYIYKDSSHLDLLHSRRGVWDQSLTGASEGGWAGLGYGVSWGKEDFNLDHGLTSGYYGREKGNSQLAILEETGIIGLIFYIFMISNILFKLINLHIKTIDPDQRVLVGIIAGGFLGIIVQSGFEAWWNSPGSPEFSYFWILVGIIRGLEILFQWKPRRIK